MSQETFHQILSLNHPELECRMAIQCSPVIAGIKPSNLLIIPKGDASSLVSLLKESKISFFLLAEEEKKVTYLIYRTEALTRYLSAEKVCRQLREFDCLGCQQLHFPGLLLLLKERYRAYIKGNGAFPHEIGLLLGYPPEDVIGFIENKGENYLCAGYWKVYENLSEKQRLFKAYEHARENIIHMLYRGICMQEVIKQYNKKICIGQ